MWLQLQYDDNLNDQVFGSSPHASLYFPAYTAQNKMAMGPGPRGPRLMSARTIDWHIGGCNVQSDEIEDARSGRRTQGVGWHHWPWRMKPSSARVLGDAVLKRHGNEVEGRVTCSQLLSRLGTLFSHAPSGITRACRYSCLPRGESHMGVLRSAL